ncbi:chromosome partitioning protein ParB [Sulfitobacter sp. BDSS02]|nr:chromosome partitioning protein ParB [Sulfitobacter sp. BDSS02]MBR9850918.1 ParB N-terminal domain-containing protein [Paracoccaceae bacterium]
MNTHIELTADDTLAPLSKLYLHPINPRQNGAPEDTAAMAASIEINGLIQNLAGYEDPKKPGQIGIVAGGRRLRALKHLAEIGRQTMDSKSPDFKAIPVKVTSDPMVARAWAGAEAATQKPLHPADEIRAYAAMADQGNSPNMIARAFAQTEAHVKRRLALSRLCSEALDALRADHITLDVAKALTLTTDPAAQLSVLTSARAGNWSALRVRAALTPDTIDSSDRRARFVGLVRYIGEGGSVTEDLFDEKSYLHDEALLDRLFKQKLAHEAEQLRKDQGWQWVKTVEGTWVDHKLTSNCEYLRKQEVELPIADQDRLAELQDRNFHDGISDAELEELDALQTRRAGDFTDAQRETGGIFVLVDHNGALKIEGAYRKRETSDNETSSDAPGRTAAPAKPDLTQSGKEDLHRIALLALQTALIEKTELVLDLFAWQLERGAPGYSNPFAITLTDQKITGEKDDAWPVDQRLAETRNGANLGTSNSTAADDFAAFTAKGKKHRNTVLTRHITRTLNTPNFDRGGLGPMIFELTGASIRKVWTPDAATYFSRLSVGALEALWAELLDLDQDDERRAIFAKLKKGEKAKELESLFADASLQEALGLSRAQIVKIDAWSPPEIRAVEAKNR